VSGFIGIDLSLTATGLASFQDGVWDTATVRTKADDGSETAYIERVRGIAAKIIAWSDPHDGDVWAIEGPSFGAKGAAVDRMFGAFHLVMAALIDHHGEPIIVPPTSIKKYATGKGNAGKDEVMLAVSRRYPDAPIHNNDESDAVTIAAMIARFYGHPIEDSMPQVNLEALTKLRRA